MMRRFFRSPTRGIPWGWMIGVALQASGVLGACGLLPTAPPVESAAAGGGEPIAPSTRCESWYGDACRAPCEEVNDCAAGLYCDSEGHCAADCKTTEDCEAGWCNSSGHCLPDEAPPDDDLVDVVQMGSGGSAEPSFGGASSTCVEGEVVFTPAPPQVWLLLDRSGSMADSLGALTRWEALGAVLLGDPSDPEDLGIVGELEDELAFGATFYTTGSSAAACSLSLEAVALTLHNYSAIRQRYRKLMPGGATPTADSIAAVVANADATDVTGGPKLLVLATDGAPGQCFPREIEPMTAVEQEVELAYGAGIRTFAVSISTGVPSDHMQRVANIGAGLPADSATPAPSFTAETQEELGSAFREILATVPPSCVFGLNGEVDVEHADVGSVRLKGESLVYQGQDGWRLASPRQVELRGAACEAIQEGETDLTISFPCEVFHPTIIK
jgi:hypothetical protein